MRRIGNLVGLVFAALLLGLAMLPPTPVQAQNRLCFAEVPDCIEGRFAEYWQQNGGLPVFGFPITPPRLENVGGTQVLVQTFERNRFELRPENARPYDVLLGRLGDERLRQLGRTWQNEPRAPSSSQPGCQFFAETSHLVCDAILRYWQSNGLNLDGRTGFTAAESLALFGLPLTEAAMETGSDGRQYLTQWFERARFELHPELGPNVVLLGLLGRETGSPAPQPAPQPAPPVADPCADVPDPVNARIRPGKCFNAGTLIAIDVFGFRPNEQVGFWFNTPEGLIFGTVQTFNIGPTGAANDLPLPTDGLTPGIWSFVMEGTSSGHKSIAYFKILGEVAPPAPPVSGDVPAPVSATISPSQGPGGTAFEAQGFGFQPGENIGVYVTAPDQSVYGAPFQVRADSSGRSEIVTFFSDPRDPKGVYAITFEGVRSKHRAIAYFRIQ
jgi:hypothetical protein